MAKAKKPKTPSYILEFELKVNAQQRKLLDVKMRVAKQVYNACLGYATKRLKAVLADQEYRLLVKTEASKERNERLRGIEKFYGYSEYDLHKEVSAIQKHFKPHIGSLEAQKLATRAFQAVEKVKYKKAKCVRFKSKWDTISVENKVNTSGLRKKNQQIIWGTLCLDFIVKKNDFYGHEALCDRTKYVRIIQREIRGKTRYYVQLIQEGIPPRKPNRNLSTDKTKRIGLDLGVSTIAIVGEDQVKLAELAPNCTTNEKELRNIQRAMERSKRSTNQKNYNENGTIKRGMKLEWSFSKRYMKLRTKRKEIYRKLAVERKKAHETLANEIVSLGATVRVETMHMQGLQKRAKKTTINRKNGKINKKKRYGKTISNRAPAMLLEIINRKLTYVGAKIEKIDTAKVKASQFNHITKEYQKKPLSARWNENVGGWRVQRDLYSSFLIRHTTDDLEGIDVLLCEKHWEQFIQLHDEEIARLKRESNKFMRWYIA